MLAQTQEGTTSTPFALEYTTIRHTLCPPRHCWDRESILDFGSRDSWARLFVPAKQQRAATMDRDEAMVEMNVSDEEMSNNDGAGDGPPVAPKNGHGGARKQKLSRGQTGKVTLRLRADSHAILKAVENGGITVEGGISLGAAADKIILGYAEAYPDLRRGAADALPAVIPNNNNSDSKITKLQRKYDALKATVNTISFGGNVLPLYPDNDYTKQIRFPQGRREMAGETVPLDLDDFVDLDPEDIKTLKEQQVARGEQREAENAERAAQYAEAKAKANAAGVVENVAQRAASADLDWTNLLLAQGKDPIAEKLNWIENVGLRVPRHNKKELAKEGKSAPQSLVGQVLRSASPNAEEERERLFNLHCEPFAAPTNDNLSLAQYNLDVHGVSQAKARMWWNSYPDSLRKVSSSCQP